MDEKEEEPHLFMPIGCNVFWFTLLSIEKLWNYYNHNNLFFRQSFSS